MEPIFQVVMQDMEKAYRAFLKTHSQIRYAGRNRMVRIFAALIAVWAGINLTTRVQHYLDNTPQLILQLTLFLLAVYYCVRSFFIPQIMRQNSRRNGIKMPVDGVLTFYPNCFVHKDTKQTCESKYPIIVQIINTPDFVLLYQNKVSATIVDKAGFTTGNPQEFLAFITEKTGAPVQTYPAPKTQ